MALGKINTFIDLIEIKTVKDAEGFSSKEDIILASVRAYREDRFASEKWANRASFLKLLAYFAFVESLILR